MATTLTCALSVQKRKGDTEPFNQDKIKAGIIKSAKDAKIDINGKFDNLIQSIINEAIITAKNETILSDEITNIVKRKLMDYQFHEVAEAYILYSNEQSKLRLEPNTELMSDFVTLTRYARYSPENKRREIYPEIVDRVKNMHINRYPQIKEELEWAFKYVYEKKVLPSMRSMQFGGKAQEANHAKGYNCSFSICNRIRFFSEALWLLLSGTGVGFSVQFQHIDQLPELKQVDQSKVRHYQIPDTIEGWAEAVHELFKSYVKGGYYIEFAYNKIRPQGSALITSGGKAPGHLPLKNSLEKVREILDKAQLRQLKPIECYDIMCILADTVYAGGIREAAMICLFSLDDGEMMNAKVGDWYKYCPWRARSNNSVVLQRNDVKKRQYDRIFRATKQWGEPGFYFTDDEDTGANPCVTEDTWIATDKGLRQVSDLIGMPFNALVDGKSYKSNGFFYTGNKPVYQINFHSGRKLKLTSNHKVMTKDGWKECKDLINDEEVLLHDHQLKDLQHSNMKFNEGLLLGWLIGDGNLVKRKDGYSTQIKFWGDDKYDRREYARSIFEDSKLNSHQHPCHDRNRFSKTAVSNPFVALESVKLYQLAQSFNIFGDLNKKGGDKKISDSVMKADLSLLRGLVRGYFDADGTVLNAPKRGRYSVRLTSSNINNLMKVQLILSRLNINCNIINNRRPARNLPMPDGKGGYKKVQCAAVHELLISGVNIAKFDKTIGFSDPNKQKKLESISDRNLLSDIKYDKVISIEYVGNHDVYDCTVPGPHAFDANSLYVHNCVEIGLNPKLEITPEIKINIEKWAEKTNRKIPKLRTGNIYWGWQQCNLTEVVAADIKSEDDLYERAKAASIIGTAQAGYTDFEYLGWVTEAICNREALLGVSMTGIMDCPGIALDPEIQRTAAQIAIETNIDIASKIGISSASRVTCVKPSGTASIVVGGVGSGIHTHHAKRYFRRIRTNPQDPVYIEFKKHNPHMCTAIDGRKELITFPIKAPDNALTRHDLAAIEFLDKVLSTQINWVIPGTAKPNLSPGVTHNVSNTITIKEHEWDDVREFLWANRKYFSGVSMLADFGDKAYANAPREEVVTQGDEAKWHDLIANHRAINWEEFVEEDDNTTLSAEKACAGGSCEITL